MKLRHSNGLVIITFSFVLFLTGCFKKDTAVVEGVQLEAPTLEPVTLAQPDVVKKTEPKDLGHLLKEQREAIYFAASLEREALKLITKNSYYDKGTLFSVLSYAFDTSAGLKRMFPLNVDCSRFRIEKQLTRLKIYKVCQKPEVLVAEIKFSNMGSEIDVEFKAREWGSVIGTSVSLINSDIRCQLLIKNKKLETMNCQNWAYLVTEDHLSATEVKLKTFDFKRNNQLQFELKGGFFKDLVENRKIAIMVPLNGQIKLIEKEIEVIDDFAEKPKPEKKVELPKKLPTVIIGGPNGQKENQQENHTQDGQQEVSEVQSGDQTQAQSSDESQGQSEDQTQGEGSDSQVEQKSPEEIQREIEQNTEVDNENGGVPKARVRGR